MKIVFILMKYSSLATLEIAILITSSAVGDAYFVKTTYYIRFSAAVTGSIIMPDRAAKADHISYVQHVCSAKCIFLIENCCIFTQISLDIHTVCP